MIEFFFLKGFLLGATIAAIGGPVSILCIRHTIKEGMLSGIAIGFGAALADALFGSIAGFGITIISDFLFTYQKIISVLGGAFLIYLGITTFFERQEQLVRIPLEKAGLLKNALTSFLITLTNPATILFFMAVTVGLQVELTNYAVALLLVAGIFLGSLSMFSAIASLVTIFYTKITYHWLALMNKVVGLGLMIFGIWIGIKALYQNLSYILWIIQ